MRFARHKNGLAVFVVGVDALATNFLGAVRCLSGVVVNVFANLFGLCVFCTRIAARIFACVDFFNDFFDTVHDLTFVFVPNVEP